MTSKHNILVVDGQGGGLGKSIISAIKANIDDTFIIGVGSNSVASNSLKKGGADVIATGENAVVYNAKNVDIIIGPIGISFANSMYGEITPIMAEAINKSDAQKYLIPISKCSAHIVGVKDLNINEYIDELIKELK